MHLDLVIISGTGDDWALPQGEGTLEKEIQIHPDLTNTFASWKCLKVIQRWNIICLSWTWDSCFIKLETEAEADEKLSSYHALSWGFE